MNPVPFGGLLCWVPLRLPAEWGSSLTKALETPFLSQQFPTLDTEVTSWLVLTVSNSSDSLVSFIFFPHPQTSTPK